MSSSKNPKFDVNRNFSNSITNSTNKYAAILAKVEPETLPLPNEILLSISQLLKGKDLKNFGLASKAFLQIAKGGVEWSMKLENAKLSFKEKLCLALHDGAKHYLAFKFPFFSSHGSEGRKRAMYVKEIATALLANKQADEIGILLILAHLAQKYRENAIFQFILPQFGKREVYEENEFDIWGKINTRIDNFLNNLKMDHEKTRKMDSVIRQQLMKIRYIISNRFKDNDMNYVTNILAKLTLDDLIKKDSELSKEIRKLYLKIVDENTPSNFTPQYAGF